MRAQLTPEEFQTPRLAQELLSWVEQELRAISAIEPKLDAANNNAHLFKRLREEAYPLGIFASLHFSQTKDIYIQLKLQNQNYDAIIINQRNTPIPFKYIEVTQAHEGEDEYLREYVLQKEGHVNAFGPVIKQGTKTTGLHVEVKDVAVQHETIQLKHLNLIDEAIKRKIGKSYPQNTALLVAFDDSVLRGDTQFHRMLHDLIEPILPSLCNFCWLAIVGRYCSTFIERDLRGMCG